MTLNDEQKKLKNDSTLVETESLSKQNDCYNSSLQEYFESSSGSSLEKLRNFAKYVPRQTLTNFLAKYEIFKKIINIQGSIIECGVFQGNGLMTWANLSSIFEPYNHQRKIIGFDTFSGIPDVSDQDKTSISEHCHPNALRSDSHEDLLKCISIYDKNRTLDHIQKVSLVKGNITQTVPDYLRNNPHTIISLLYLDCVVYEPTKTALKYFLPKMPKGSIIAFDELNSDLWPGETIAVIEELGLSKREIHRFPFASFLSYTII